MSITVPSSRSSCHVTVAGGLWFASWAGYVLLASTNGFGLIASWHNEQRAAQVVMFGVTAAVLLVSLLHSASLRRVPALPLATWMILALGLLSALNAGLQVTSLVDISLFFALGAVVLMSAALTRAAPLSSARFLRWTVLLIASAHVLGVVVRYGTALSMARPPDMEVLLLGYANPRFPSALYSMLLPFLAAIFIDPREHRTLRYGALVAMTLLWTINVALGTRAVLFAYAVAVPSLLFFLGRKETGRIARPLVLSAIAGVAIYWFAFYLVPGWFIGEEFVARPFDALASPNGRELVWRSSLDAIVGAPLLGIGPMNFAAIPHVWAAHPHNWVLQFAAEYGIPAALLACYLAWKLLSDCGAELRSKTAELRALYLPVYAAVTVALAYGLVDGNLVMPVSQSVFFLLVGLLIGGTLPASSAEEAMRSWRRPNLVASVIAITAGTIVAVSYGIRTLPEQAESVARYRQLYSPDRFFVPRFWEQGLLFKEQ